MLQGKKAFPGRIRGQLRLWQEAGKYQGNGRKCGNRKSDWKYVTRGEFTIQHRGTRLRKLLKGENRDENRAPPEKSPVPRETPQEADSGFLRAS